MIAWASVALAGAWTRGPSEAYAKLSVDGFHATSTVGAARSYESLQLGAYAEVGLLDEPRLHWTTWLPFVVGSVVTEVDGPVASYEVRTTSLVPGDLWLGPQLQLARHVPISVRFDAKVPLYSLSIVGARDPVYGPLYPAPGDGQLDFRPAVAAGLARGAVFSEVHAGWVFRSGLSFDGTAPRPGSGPDLAWKIGASSPAWLGWAEVSGRLATSRRAATRQWLAVAVGGGHPLTERLWLEVRGAFDAWAVAAHRGIALGAGVSWSSPGS